MPHAWGDGPDTAAIAAASALASALAGVANLTALGVLDDSSLPDGASIPVASVDDEFSVFTGLGLVVDGISIVNALTAGRQWVRQLTRSTRWITKDTWYIDEATGDDENDGGTSGAALKTLHELFHRRLWGAFLAQTTTVNVLTSITHSATFVRVFRESEVPDTKLLNIVGARTIVASGVISAWTAATATAAAILADTTTPTVWAPYINTSYGVVMTSGAAIDNVTYPRVDLGGNAVNLNSPAGGDGTTADPAPGDTFDVYTMPQITSDVWCANGCAEVFVDNLHFAKRVFVNNWFGEAFDSVTFRFCTFDDYLKSNGSHVFARASLIDGVCMYSNGSGGTLYGCTMGGTLQLFNYANVTVHNIYAEGTCYIQTSELFVWNGHSTGGKSYQAYSSGDGFQLWENGVLKFRDSGNAGVSGTTVGDVIVAYGGSTAKWGKAVGTGLMSDYCVAASSGGSEVQFEDTVGRTFVEIGAGKADLNYGIFFHNSTGGV